MTLTLYVVGRRWPDGRVFELLAGPFCNREHARGNLTFFRQTDAADAVRAEMLEFWIEAELRGAVE